MGGLKKIFLIIMLFSSVVFANEEAKREYSEGEKEYREKIVRLNVLESKIYAGELTFQALVEEKNQTKSKQEALAVIERMKTVKSEMDENVEKFNKVRAEVEYKYPDKGKTVMRRYAPMQKKSLQQLEKKSTLDKDLTTAKQSAQKAYKPFIEEAEKRRRKKVEQEQLRHRGPVSDDEESSLPKKIKIIK